MIRAFLVPGVRSWKERREFQGKEVGATRQQEGREVQLKGWVGSLEACMV